MKRFLFVFILSLSLFKSFSQHSSNLPADQWVDSVFKTLTENQKIAQLMVIRLSSIDLSTRIITFYDKEVESAINQYGIGGICLFQGGPVAQANLINHFQQISKTPILIC